MKTIALKDKTFNLIKELKEKQKMKSFDRLIIDLIITKEKIPEDMFGSLKGKSGGFTPKERKKIWRDSKRNK